MEKQLQLIQEIRSLALQLQQQETTDFKRIQLTVDQIKSMSYLITDLAINGSCESVLYFFHCFPAIDTFSVYHLWEKMLQGRLATWA